MYAQNCIVIHIALCVIRYDDMKSYNVIHFYSQQAQMFFDDFVILMWSRQVTNHMILFTSNYE